MRANAPLDPPRALQDGWFDVCAWDALAHPDARASLCVDGRHIIAVRDLDGALHAIDATCYHMGGPLLRAEIEDVPGKGRCAVCPWHGYHVSLTSGERVYKTLDGEWVGIPKKQRVHEIEEDAEARRVRVRLRNDGEACESDRYAYKKPPPAFAGGARGPPRSGSVFARGRGGVSGDGTRECGPGARTAGVRSMVAASMRGGDGAAPWALGGAREAGRLARGDPTSVRRVRKRVTFHDGDDEHDSSSADAGRAYPETSDG